MTGHKTRIKNAKVTTGKDGKTKVSNIIKFRDASHAIRAKKSNKIRPGKLPPAA
jgi:hypothetical protein